MTPDNPWKDAEQDEVSEDNWFFNEHHLVGPSLDFSLIGTDKTLKEWAEFWEQEGNKYGELSSQGQVRYFANMTDIYQAFKNSGDEGPGLIEYVKKHVRKGGVVLTSTKLKYSDDNVPLIVHSQGTDREQIIEVRDDSGEIVQVPNYTTRKVSDAIVEPSTFFFLQALLGTKDDANTIETLLKKGLESAAQLYVDSGVSDWSEDKSIECGIMLPEYEPQPMGGAICVQGVPNANFGALIAVYSRDEQR